MSSQLIEHINYQQAYRKNRLEAAHWVLKHPETLEELLAYCFGSDQPLATKATWVLEFVFRDQLSHLFPYLDQIIASLPKVKSDGQVRTFAYLCELLAVHYYKKKDPKIRSLLSNTHKNILTECCFDWLITEQKVACQARAMLALYYLGTEMDWIHPELKTIIERQLPKGSAGYVNRGKKVIALIAAQEGNQRN